jgi:OOP family OmpA-OmpF porin
MVLALLVAMRTVLVVALLAASGAAAHAGTYLGLGIGTGANLSDSVNDSFQADGRSARVALGYRVGRFAVEGMYSGFNYIQANAAAGGQIDSRSLQLAGKYNLPLNNDFELYGRFGLLRTDLTPVAAGQATASGTGYTFSVGLEYKLDLLVAGFGVYIDWTRNQATFDTGTSVPFDQTATMLTAGVNLAL